MPLALRLTRPDGRTTGKVRVTVDFSSFRDAFGADYAGRLGMAVLADCAATTPQNLGCRDRKPVPSAVDTKGMTVSADVDLAAVTSTVDAPPLSAPATGGRDPPVLGDDGRSSARRHREGSCTHAADGQRG